jgi:hypothetical protein
VCGNHHTIDAPADQLRVGVEAGNFPSAISSVRSITAPDSDPVSMAGKFPAVHCMQRLKDGHCRSPADGVLVGNARLFNGRGKVRGAFSMNLSPRRESMPKPDDSGDATRQKLESGCAIRLHAHRIRLTPRPGTIASGGNDSREIKARARIARHKPCDCIRLTPRAGTIAPPFPALALRLDSKKPRPLAQDGA